MPGSTGSGLAAAGRATVVEARLVGSRRRRGSRPGEERAGVQTADQAGRTVDEGHVAVGEGGPVVRLAPDQHATGRALQPVAILGVVPLVLDAVADLVGNHGPQGGEAELEDT